MIYTIAGVLVIVASVILTLVVLVQNSKGGGLSNAFGASNITSMIGTRRATQDIEKITWYFAFGLMVLAFVANIGISSGKTAGSKDTNFGKIIENATAVPTVNNAPAAAPSEPAQ